MSEKSREEVLILMRERYKKRGRKGRTKLIDEFCEFVWLRTKICDQAPERRDHRSAARARSRGDGQPQPVRHAAWHATAQYGRLGDPAQAQWLNDLYANSSGEHSRPGCWFRHPAETNFCGECGRRVEPD